MKTLSTIIAGVVASSTLFAATPENDRFDQARQITGPRAFLATTSEGATREIGEPAAIGQSSVWWVWTAPGNGILSIDPVAVGFRPAVSVFVGDTLADLSAVAHGSAENELTPDVSVPVSKGMTYRIAVAAATITAPYSGPLLFKLDFTPQDIPDTWIGADDYYGRPLLEGNRAQGAACTYFASTVQPNEPNAGHGGGGVWWEWVAPHSGLTVIDTIGSDFGTLLSIYKGERLERLELIADGDNFEGPHAARVSFQAFQGQVYQIKVSGHARCLVPPGCSGNVLLHLNQIEVPNDDLQISRAVMLELNGRSGQLYQLQESENMTTWANVGNAFQGSNTVVRWFFPASADGGRVYRLLKQPSLNP